MKVYVFLLIAAAAAPLAAYWWQGWIFSLALSAMWIAGYATRKHLSYLKILATWKAKGYGLSWWDA